MFISAILRQEDHQTPVLGGVKPHWFVTHHEEWEWIDRYISRHRKCPSKVLFKDKFPNFTVLKSDDVEYCLTELRGEYLKRSLVQVVNETVEKIKNDDEIPNILSAMQSSIVALQADSDGMANESDVVDDWEVAYDEVARRYERMAEKGIAGVPTGFTTLDMVTGGAQPGDYWIVAARLGQGKTWTLLRIDGWQEL